jgi:hypothetical protein
MSKRTPYLEIMLTVAVMVFLALVIAGTFNQRSDDVAQMTLPRD